MKYKVHEVKLKNGIEGLLVDTPNVKVTRFHLDFRAGKYLCPSAKTEVAHVLEHMIFKANKDFHDEKEFMVEMCKNGAYINAFTSRNDICYIAYCADFEWERILKLLIMAISKPLLLDKHFATEIKVVKEELTGYLNKYGRILDGEMDKISSGADRTLTASIKSLGNIQPKDIRSFYKKTHFTKNMRFVITGDLRSKTTKMKRILENLRLPDGDSRLEKFKSPFHKVEHPIAIEYESVDKFYFSLEVIRKKVLSLDEKVHLLIVREILTGAGLGHLTSRINSQARARGLNYGIRSYAQNVSDAGMFFINGTVEKENASALFDLIALETKKLLGGKLSTSEVEEIKKRIMGSHYSEELTTHSLASHYMNCIMLDELVDYDALINLLPFISKKQIIDTFRQMFAEKHWYFGLLGPETATHKDDLYQKLTSVF